MDIGDSSTTRRWNVWLGPLLLIAVGSAMAAWTWNYCGDPLVDAARDLYAAQQMAQGRALYHDIVYLFGPLAPSVLSLAFLCFGASVAVAKTLNLTLLTLLMVVLYRLLARLSDRLAATVACAVFLTTFAFAQLTPLRNYNFLTPYTNSATYGFILGVMIVASLDRFFRGGGQIWMLAAGAAAGLSFLTKPEIFAACFVTLAAGAFVGLWVRRLNPRSAATSIFCCIIGFVAAPMILLLILSAQSSWDDVWSGATAGYHMALDPRLRQMRFELENVGFWRPARNLNKIFFWSCVYTWILLPPSLLALLVRSQKSWTRYAAIGCTVTGAVALVYWRGRVNWQEAFIALPVLILCAVILLGAGLVRANIAGKDASLTAGRFLFALFGFLMLDRMILNTRIYHYGFVSAAGAMMLVVVLLVGLLPTMIDGLGRRGLLLRGAGMGLLIGVVAIHLMSTARTLSLQTIELDGGFRGGDQTGEILHQAMIDLAARAHRGDSLAALPEACWVNFVTGMPNPTPYELLDPIGVIRAGGEEPILRAYQASPPTWIMLVHHNTGDIGPRFFGTDYFMTLRQWIDENYDQVALFGAPPLRSNAFGIALLRRKVQ